MNNHGNIQDLYFILDFQNNNNTKLQNYKTFYVFV